MDPMLLLLLLLLIVLNILIVNQIIVVLIDNLDVSFVNWQTIAEKYFFIISILHELNYARFVRYSGNLCLVVLK